MFQLQYDLETLLWLGIALLPLKAFAFFPSHLLFGTHVRFHIRIYLWILADVWDPNFIVAGWSIRRDSGYHYLAWRENGFILLYRLMPSSHVSPAKVHSWLVLSWAVALLVDCFSSMHRAQGLHHQHQHCTNWRCGARACNSCVWNVRAEGSGISQLNSKLEASLGYVRSCHTPTPEILLPCHQRKSLNSELRVKSRHLLKV